MNLLKRIKISKKESCPCGSGEVFINCCHNKDFNPPIETKKPPEVLIGEMMRKSMKKLCMHPDQQNCKGRIKGAHALQNNKIISLLAGDERHVYLMDTKRSPLIVPLNNGKQELIIEMSRTSANAATTETCFCDLHDNIAFAAIEKGAPDFDETSEIMKFVYAYKAFIFEYYKVWMSMDIFRTQFAKHPTVFSRSDMVSWYRSLQLNMKEFDSIKEHFDKEILAGEHTGITTCIIKIPEQINFANYAYIAPDYDLNGKKIKNKVKGFIHRLAITAIPEKGHSYILLSCLDSEKEIYLDLFNQLQSSPIDKVKFYISLILPLYSENMVLSPSLWNSWDEETQMAYTFYANLKDKDFFIYNKMNGMILRKAAKMPGFSYGERNKINLFELLN
ncbi:hypothetical protein [Neobacillus niacini]|uniref:hypothetical protein n=1 Tax=Neobacillus niacini TaxID=86668 RepID=UPI002866BA21|nr:hypothetical protein [Neobacillus niacini]MDR7001728.1 hypothetical protein [Neobacillus niacini]